MTNNVLKLVLFVFCAISFQNAKAQTTVKGTITDASNEMPLPGVNIIVKGSSNGTISDFDGNFTLKLPNNSSVVIFSFMGYNTQEVPYNGSELMNIKLEPNTEQLDQVVVTALGIKKESKALGYSLTNVDGDELSTVKQQNAINALQGKVAGVNITGAASGPSGTSKVVIRGASSLSGTNQPLYVVDGIPINNQNLGSATSWGGIDFGDGISSINPDDIESMSVLKGGAAAALYGSNASGGVILITTKSGKGQKGFGVEISHSTQFDKINTDLYDFQTEYGQGTFGVAPTNQEQAINAGMYSWGAKLGSVATATQFDGVDRPYEYTGNNFEKYYRTANTFTNTVAISKGAEDYHFRFSATNLENDDITPNSNLNRKSFSLNAGVVMSKKLTLDVNTKYVLEDAKNRPRSADSPGNGNFTVALNPPNVDLYDYKPGYNEDGTELRISSSNYHQNPYFSAYKFSNQSKKNRFIGSSTLKYQITDWLYALGRMGIDQYTARLTQVEPYGTNYKPLGGMRDKTFNVKTVDADVMLGLDKDFGDKFSTQTIVGANSNSFTNEITELNGQSFVIPGLVDISNVENKNYTYELNKAKKGSLYFSTEWSYDDYLYLTVTGRNDWFSTLSLAGKSSPNSYFYPSASSSFVFSEAFEMPNWISYGKIRAGYSDIGGGAQDPYALSLTYGINDTYGANGSSVPIGSINGSELPNLNLKPFSKEEYEFGLELKLLRSRLNLDMAYYANKTTNDIVPITISNTTGYSSAIVNIGEVSNKGIELLLTGKPIKTDNFNWEITYNFGYNKNEVIKTDNDGNPFFIGAAANGINSQSGSIVGEPVGALYGTTFERNEDGTIVYDPTNGLPVVGEYKVLGHGVAPYTMGITNNFRYKNFNLNFLIDAKFGGDIFSGTSAFANYYGASKNTLEGRENGLTVSGVDTSGNDFTTTIASENVSTYYQRLYEIAESNMQKADFIKFRELSLGYQLPESVLSKTFISSAKLSFIARNLFFIVRHTENIDPESAFNNTYAAGLERFGLPSTRTYGFSLNVKF